MNITPKKAKSSLRPLKIQPRPPLEQKSSQEFNGTVRSPIRTFVLWMFIKANPHNKISQISNLEPQIHERIRIENRQLS